MDALASGPRASEQFAAVAAAFVAGLAAAARAQDVAAAFLERLAARLEEASGRVGGVVKSASGAAALLLRLKRAHQPGWAGGKGVEFQD